MEPSSISVLEEKHLRWLRYEFQRRLESGRQPGEEDLVWASEWLEKLAALPEPNPDDIRHTNIHKVLRRIGNSVDILEDDTHGVKKRAGALAQRYTTVLERPTQEGNTHSNVVGSSDKQKDPDTQTTAETDEAAKQRYTTAKAIESSELPSGTSASEDVHRSMHSPRYSSIQITEKAQDIERLFPLIIEFIDYPDRASTVLDFSYLHTASDHQVPSGGTTRGRGTKRGKPLDQERNDGSHQTTARHETATGRKLQTALANIGLSREEQETWIQKLSWKAAEATASRSSTSNPLDRAPDLEFTRYAGALLLFLCPNVIRLTYEINKGPIRDLLMRNNDGGLSRRYLQKLQEVTFLPTNHWLFNDPRFYNKMDLLSEVIILHRLPELQTVTIDGVTVDYDSGYLDDLSSAASTSTVSRLNLRHSDLPSEVVANLMNVSKRLEYLALTEGGLASEDGGFTTPDLKVLSEALCHHSSTLKTLDLDIHEHYGRHSEVICPSQQTDGSQNDQEAPQSLSTHPAMSQAVLHNTLCFREFPTLVTLSIGIEQLVCCSCMAGSHLVDTLPQSLQHIAIKGFVKGTNDFLDKEISHFLEQYPTQLPHLEKVEGIDTSIPNGQIIENPDGDAHLLWHRPQPQVEWAKVIETAMIKRYAKEYSVQESATRAAVEQWQGKPRPDLPLSMNKLWLHGFVDESHEYENIETAAADLLVPLEADFHIFAMSTSLQARAKKALAHVKLLEEQNDATLERFRTTNPYTVDNNHEAAKLRLTQRV